MFRHNLIGTYDQLVVDGIEGYGCGRPTHPGDKELVG